MIRVLFLPYVISRTTLARCHVGYIGCNQNFIVGYLPIVNASIHSGCQRCYTMTPNMSPTRFTKITYMSPNLLPKKMDVLFSSQAWQVHKKCNSSFLNFTNCRTLQNIKKKSLA